MNIKEDQFNFQVAQSLRKSHCDRKDDAGHKCVGTVTIKSGVVCLDCPLCGKGEQIPGWRTFVANKLDMIFCAAGIKWDALTLERQLEAIKKYVEVRD